MRRVLYILEMTETKSSDRNGSPQWLAEMGPILETLNDGVLITDDSGQVLFANAVFEEMTGIARSEIIGRDGSHIYLEAEDYARLLEIQKNTREKRPRPRRIFPSYMKDGGRLPVVVSARVIYSPEESASRW